MQTFDGQSLKWGGVSPERGGPLSCPVTPRFRPVLGRVIRTISPHRRFARWSMTISHRTGVALCGIRSVSPLGGSFWRPPIVGDRFHRTGITHGDRRSISLHGCKVKLFHDVQGVCKSLPVTIYSRPVTPCFRPVTLTPHSRPVTLIFVWSWEGSAGRFHHTDVTPSGQ